MSAYLLVSYSVSDPEQLAKYREAVPAVIRKYGGRHIVRGGDITVLEGSHDGRRRVVLEFPSMEAIHEFWNSSDYAVVKPLRAGAGEFDVLAVPGV